MATLKQLIESEIGDFFAGFGHTGEPETTEKMQSQLLARVMPLLAGMGQEPVADVVAWHHPTEERTCDIRLRRHDLAPGPLYAAPQLPQPAVPDETPREHANGWPLSHSDYADGWNACRAAMLQGAEPAKTGLTLREGLAAIRNSGIAIDAEKIQAERDALSEPVQGWIPCSERMPDFDTRVLLYFPDYGGHIEDGCIGDEGDGPYHYFFDGDSLRHEPTHWMQLPAAPQQEVK